MDADQLNDGQVLLHAKPRTKQQYAVRERVCWLSKQAMHGLWGGQPSPLHQQQRNAAHTHSCIHIRYPVCEWRRQRDAGAAPRPVNTRFDRGKGGVGQAC